MRTEYDELAAEIGKTLERLDTLFARQRELLKTMYGICDDNGDEGVIMSRTMLVTRENVLEQLNRIIEKYGEANEDNEMSFECDVRELLEQVEEYDNYHLQKHQNPGRKHSEEAIILMEEFVKQLIDITDGCAECFPFDLVDELKEEYGILLLQE